MATSEGELRDYHLVVLQALVEDNNICLPAERESSFFEPVLDELIDWGFVRVIRHKDRVLGHVIEGHLVMQLLIHFYCENEELRERLAELEDE